MPRGRSSIRDLADGPEASVERLFHPVALPTEEIEAIEGLRQTARSSSNLDLLKVCWLNRILRGPDPLREKMTLFWHGHFATSNRKVDSVALMDRQNETLRTHAMGGFAALLEAIIADPAMLVWLDGGTSKKAKPNENFAREFLELFTLGVGHYHEQRYPRGRAGVYRLGAAGIARGLSGNAGLQPRRDSGRWRSQDIPGPDRAVGPGRHRPDHARAPRGRHVSGRKLYRWFVSESGTPGPELIEPLAEEIKRHRFAIGPIVRVILRSKHFYSTAAYRQRIKSPIESDAGLVRTLEVPRPATQPAGTGGGLRRTGPGAVRPAQCRGLGRRLALDQQRHAARTHELGRRRDLGPLRKRSGPVRPTGLGGPLQTAAGRAARRFRRPVARGRARRRSTPAGTRRRPRQYCRRTSQNASTSDELPRVSIELVRGPWSVVRCWAYGHAAQHRTDKAIPRVPRQPRRTTDH